MSVRRTYTTGWVHPIPGPPTIVTDVKKVEPIVPVQDRNEDVEDDEWYIEYCKEGKVKYVRTGSRGRLLAKA